MATDKNFVIKNGLTVGTSEIITSAGNLTNIGAITTSGNLHAGDGTNISMDASANGQLEVDGNGYQGAIALDGSAMHLYHNSSSRDLVLGTNETARLTIGGTGTFDFNSNNLQSIGTISSGAITSSGLLTLNDNYALINAGTTSNTTLEPVIWARSQVGASVVQMNVQGDEWQFGGGGTLDTTPILKLKYGTNAATFAGTINSDAITSTGTVTATGGNSTNWNTAYGWGNHASASYATESYVGTQISNLVDSSPAALNTLNELAAALGDDANFSTTVTNSIATKLPLAGGTMTGTLAMGANAITSTGTISSGAITSSSGMLATNTWFNNNQPATDNAVYSGYGAIGNRGAFYITNGGGVVEIGNGNVHNSNPSATFSTTTLNLGASRAFQMNGQTVIDASRNLTNIGTISSGAITSSGHIQSAGALKVTETGTAQVIMIGNQDSGGTNTPAMIMGVNGRLKFGYGNSWSGEGGTFTEVVNLEAGNLDISTGGLELGGQTVIDSSRNLTNIGTISSGAITSSSGITASKSANISQVAITSSSNAVAWDATAAANAYYATTQNTTFSAPSNAVEGAIISVEIAQGGTAYTVAWNTVFQFAASTAPTVTATANKTDIFSFRYNGSVWQEIGRVQNLAQT